MQTNMGGKHQYIVGGLFLSHGLIRVGLAFLVLSISVEMNFSAVMIMFAMGVPSLFGGYNLLTRKPAAHSILSIAAVINIIDFPFGAALSVYYYWYWKYQCGAPNPFKDNRALKRAALR